MGGRQKLTIASGLLVGCMAPLCFEYRYGELQLSEPPIWIITLITAGVALWAYFGKRAGWVLALIRTTVQILGAALALMEISGHGTRATVHRLQALSTLALAVAALWLFLDRETRALVWGPAADARPPVERPPSWLRDRRLVLGLVGLGAVIAAAEQRLIYEHFSLAEWLLRCGYVALPWLGAWLFAVWGKDRWLVTALGALVGEMLSDVLSVLASGGAVEAALWRLLFPVYSLPALLFGLALGLCARRSLPVLGSVLPIGYALYRAASVFVASSGGAVPVRLWGLALVAGVGVAAVVFLFRSPAADAPPSQT